MAFNEGQNDLDMGLEYAQEHNLNQIMNGSNENQPQNGQNVMR